MNHRFLSRRSCSVPKNDVAMASRRIWEAFSGFERRADSDLGRSACGIIDGSCLGSAEVSTSRLESPRCAVRALAAERKEGGVK
jgi:hypothetical protein